MIWDNEGPLQRISPVGDTETDSSSICRSLSFSTTRAIVKTNCSTSLMTALNGEQAAGGPFESSDEFGFTLSESREQMVPGDRDSGKALADRPPPYLSGRTSLQPGFERSVRYRHPIPIGSAVLGPITAKCLPISCAFLESLFFLFQALYSTRWKGTNKIGKAYIFQRKVSLNMKMLSPGAVNRFPRSRPSRRSPGSA